MKSAGICYIDHATGDSDHMNAHIETEKCRKVTAYIDGGARGNPGPAGYGVCIKDGSYVVEEFYGDLGYATNNVAEYAGLLAALAWADANNYTSLHVKADSKLVIEQMCGRWKVKNQRLRVLHADAQALARKIGNVTYEHISREYNTDADRLSNLGMDKSESRK